jgi:very-short-patch-repair endonuclease
LRFWNHEIFDDTDAIMDVIAEAVHWSVHPENPKNRT